MPDWPLPVRRYLLTLPLAALAFMGLAILDQRETFLAAWGLGVRESAALPAANPAAEAEAAVRAFNLALEHCYAQGSVLPLRSQPVAPEVVRAVELELSHPEAGEASRGLRLRQLRVVQVEPLGASGWSLTTEETWAWPDPTPRPWRLRFRYRLAASGGGLRVEEMTPLLPEPVNAADR